MNRPALRVFWPIAVLTFDHFLRGYRGPSVLISSPLPCLPAPKLEHCFQRHTCIRAHTLTHTHTQTYTHIHTSLAQVVLEEVQV